MKIKLANCRMNANSMMKFEEEPNILTTNYSKLGKRVEKIFPLLNPDLTFSQATEEHRKITEMDDPKFKVSYEEYKGAPLNAQ